MILYHFTSQGSAALIVAGGRIRPEPWWYGECPPVIWLTATAQRAAYKGFSGAEALTHTEVRFTVDVPAGDLSPWRPWAMRHEVSEEACERAADGRPARWYVCERPIPRTEWTRVIWSGTGHPFTTPD